MAAVPTCSVLVLGILSAVGGGGRRSSWRVAIVARQARGEGREFEWGDGHG
jgi:hypothetical protein